MPPGRPETKVIEEQVHPQVDKEGNTRITLPKKMLRSAGANPCTAERIPDVITLDYYKGGDDDGTLVVNLKHHVEKYQSEQDGEEAEIPATDGGVLNGER